METKQDIIEDSAFYTELALYQSIEGYDVIIYDQASLDDDGWQIREMAMSRKGQDDYIQVTHGDGYNGYTVAEHCMTPTQQHTASVLAHLGIDGDRLDEIVAIIDDREHLNSCDWSMLEGLKEDAGYCAQCNLQDGDHEDWCTHID